MGTGFGKDSPEFCRRLVLVLIAAAVAIPLLYKSRPKGEYPLPAAFDVSPAGRIRVVLSGDVRHPGVYELADNTVTDSVITMAVPARRVNSYQSTLSPAAPIRDGQVLHISISSTGTATLSGSEAPGIHRLLLGMPLDLNRASPDDLEALPGVGPALARRIVEYRQSNGGVMRVEELQAVEGIGPKKYTRLKMYF